jgi:hypothetical protein
MKWRTLKRLLKPRWSKLLLFAFFVATALGGRIQAWAISDVPPEPPLYDLLRPFPIWPIWMILLIPLALVSSPLRLGGIEVMGGPHWLFVTANVVYFYFLSCLLILGLDWAKAKWESRRT